MTFKVGDLVEIIPGSYNGAGKGMVIDVREDHPYPYVVAYSDNESDVFKEPWLKLLTPTTNLKDGFVPKFNSL